MPLIEINTLKFDNYDEIPLIIESLAKNISNSLNIPFERIVIYWNILSPNFYLHNGKFSNKLSKDCHQPIVKINAIEDKDEEFKNDIILIIVSTLCAKLMLSKNNIAVMYCDIRKNQLFTMGKFLK